METFGDSLKSEHFGNASFLVRASKNAILYVDRWKRNFFENADASLNFDRFYVNCRRKHVKKYTF